VPADLTFRYYSLAGGRAGTIVELTGPRYAVKHLREGDELTAEGTVSPGELGELVDQLADCDYWTLDVPGDDRRPPPGVPVETIEATLQSRVHSVRFCGTPSAAIGHLRDRLLAGVVGRLVAEAEQLGRREPDPHRLVLHFDRNARGGDTALSIVDGRYRARMHGHDATGTLSQGDLDELVRQLTELDVWTVDSAGDGRDQPTCQPWHDVDVRLGSHRNAMRFYGTPNARAGRLAAMLYRLTGRLAER
jgi:hypothetical protein